MENSAGGGNKPQMEGNDAICGKHPLKINMEHIIIMAGQRTP